MTVDARPARSFPVVIVGGGSGGLSVAARLCAVLPPGSVAIVEPSDKHYYQPIWTLVGGGVFDKSISERPEADYVPEGAVWIRERVTAFDAERHQVELASGERLGYEQLVVALGIQLDWHKIDGLAGALGKDGLCSNYRYDLVDSTWQTLRGLTEGNAIFTFPSTPVKCAGAPQKIMYLADEHLRSRGGMSLTHNAIHLDLDSTAIAYRFALGFFASLFALLLSLLLGNLLLRRPTPTSPPCP